VLTTILGGQGGRLFVELRDRAALAYRIGAYSVDGIDPGYVAVYISCSPDKLGAAMDGIRRELGQVVSKGVTSRELKRAIKYLVGTHDISLQRRSSVASAIAFHEAYGLGYRSWQRYGDEIAKVTIADVKSMAQRTFDWDKAVIATVMPAKVTPAVKRRAQAKVRKRAVRPRVKKTGKRAGKR
jgi:zinc protease